jgi:prepilin-type N-terminal cleavage/methylation domain-containing protein
MMRPRIDTQALRDERGFTLVEVLVAMTLTVIVMFAILTTLDNFTTNAARQTRITDANEQVRSTMDRIVSDLRQAKTLEVAGANDLVYTVADSATATRRERICLDASSRLWRTSITTASPPATPIAAGSACPTAGGYQVGKLLSANSVSNPLFRYDTATPANVRVIGLTFALNAGNGGQADISTLRASSFVRAKSETALAVTDGDLTTSCNTSGVPTLTLAAGVGPLTVTYTDIDGHALGSAAAGASLPLAAGSTTVIATISATTGAITQLLKTLAC